MDAYTETTQKCPACGFEYLYSERVEEWRKEYPGDSPYQRKWTAFACPNCKTVKGEWTPTTVLR